MQERLPKDDNASNILNACNSKVHLYWQHSKVESESNPNMSRRKGPRYLGLHKPTRLRPAGLADSTHGSASLGLRFPFTHRSIRLLRSTPMASAAILRSAARSLRLRQPLEQPGCLLAGRAIVDLSISTRHLSSSVPTEVISPLLLFPLGSGLVRACQGGRSGELTHGFLDSGQE